jgi:hypothetical protein
MAELNKRWWTYGGGAGDNGGSAALTLNGFGPSWIVATPLLQFVNGHSSESFALAGVSGWIRANPNGSIIEHVEFALWDFGSWWTTKWGDSFTEITFALRLRNMNASAIGTVEIWG